MCGFLNPHDRCLYAERGKKMVFGRSTWSFLCVTLNCKNNDCNCLPKDSSLESLNCFLHLLTLFCQGNAWGIAQLDFLKTNDFSLLV